MVKPPWFTAFGMLHSQPAWQILFCMYSDLKFKKKPLKWIWSEWKDCLVVYFGTLENCCLESQMGFLGPTRIQSHSWPHNIALFRVIFSFKSAHEQQHEQKFNQHPPLSSSHWILLIVILNAAEIQLLKMCHNNSSSTDTLTFNSN